jgi:hypothetical protein
MSCTVEMGHIFSHTLPESRFFPFRTHAPPSVFPFRRQGHMFSRLIGTAVATLACTVNQGSNLHKNIQ